MSSDITQTNSYPSDSLIHIGLEDYGKTDIFLGRL